MKILGAIIAGGKSSRMGQDKALMPFCGKPLIAHVVLRLGPQVDALVINANSSPLSRREKVADRPDEGLLPNSIFEMESAERPSSALSSRAIAFGEGGRAPSPAGGRVMETLKIIPDLVDIGTPLAGLHAVLTYASENSFDAVLSAPCDAPLLPEDLRLRLQGEGAAIACSGGQAHFLTGFWPVATLPLLAGLRRVQDFAAATKARQVEWVVQGHDPFTNLNTPEDLARLSEKP
jgi:molybdopterin-guanine dinucleotide biosynthesis protein A